MWSVPAGTIPNADQISLGSAGNTQDVVGFSASSANFAQRTVGLYTSAALTTLQTLQFGTYIPGNLVLGSPTANSTLILQNPIDLYSASAGTSVLFSSIRGIASQVPEGEYAGAISNSSLAAVSVTYGGNGGLLFTSSASSFSAASLQLAGGGLFIGSADYANGQTGPLGSGTSALVIGVTSGTSATASGANLAFMTYGPNSRIIGSSPSTLFTNRNIIVNPVPGNGGVVLGGFTDDYTAFNGGVQLNGPATFYASQAGRVDFTGPISGSGGVQIGASSPVYVEGAGATGIQLGSNGTIAFTVANSYSGSTTVASGRFLVNGSLYASSTASTVSVSAGTLGGTGTIYGAVVISNNAPPTTMIEAGMTAGSPLTLANGLTVPFNYSNGSYVIFQFDSLAPAGSPGLVVDNGLTNVGNVGSSANTQEIQITGAISGTGTYALIETDSSGTQSLASGVSNGTFVLNPLLPNRAVGNLEINPTNPQELDLLVTGLYSVAWTGLHTGDWNAYGNFLQMGGMDNYGKFQPNDAVVFSDSAAIGGTTHVTLNSGNVSPSSMTFENQTSTYTISGTASITGNTGLSLTNGGTLVIENTNTFTGLTLIGPGATLQLGNAGAGPDGYLPNTTISDSGSLVYSLTGQQTFTNPITGPGVLQANSGAVTLTSTGNTFSGGTTISGGTLEIGANAGPDVRRLLARPGQQQFALGVQQLRPSDL